jgi:hypothetical protein
MLLDGRHESDAKLVIATMFSQRTGFPLKVFMDIGTPETMEFVASLVKPLDKSSNNALQLPVTTE